MAKKKIDNEIFKTFMRMVAIHRGIEKLCKDRNKLIDKHMA